MPYAPYRGEFSERAHETVPVPMPDGWRRPLGIAALEDKILLRAMAEEVKLGARRGHPLRRSW